MLSCNLRVTCNKRRYLKLRAGFFYLNKQETNIVIKNQNLSLVNYPGTQVHLLFLSTQALEMVTQIGHLNFIQTPLCTGNATVGN